MSFRVWEDGKFTEIDSPDDLVNRVKTSLEYYHNEMKRAREKANKTREEVAAGIVNEHDAENARLKEELSFAIASVSSEKELDAYISFTSRHLACRNTKATGGACPWIMQYATGIGMTTKLRCPVCGQEEDITDTSVW